MKIRLTDVGRVKEAELEIDGITVVAGNNGSGKSTVSKGLYTILESSYDVEGKIEKQQLDDIVSMRRDWYRKMPLVLKQAVRSLRIIHETVRVEGLDKEKFFQRARAAFSEENTSKEIEQQIDELYERYVGIYRRTIEQYRKYIAQVVADEVFYRQVNTENNSTIARMEFIEEKSYLIEFEKNHVTAMYSSDSFVQPIYITTSDLIDTVGNNNRLFYAQKYGGVSYPNTKLVELLMLEKTTKNFTVEEYERLQEQHRQMDIIFQQVLEGDIHVEKGSLVYYDEWAGGNIALGNVASGVRIFLILKKLLDNGVFLKPTCLLIDEPETNLHPEWQLRLAEMLVLLYKKMGVKVYTNTHSPYFARAIEFYAHQYNELEQCRFYLMKPYEDAGMYVSEDVSEHLGKIYDMLAAPFSKIM